ncbi:UDP-N-acetylmuramoyl-tripeptide--D-alanyl-D-alanine ligase [Halalkalibacterium halodurans]|uniref:UDP-N-acetylmuramoyl-tripeptide--D-alanyl-D-alanine ligase n=1 Tax=Halalkalibacterium halodurans (strain ATCC BAA-125 / DSM 18197 / FERM 7344 / JCM 9153 / C-125) TaxID=272558 RepID=Q9K9S5_HALH5|nr:UDP-N-acetylmuramoyl-tripeptide--D-alanyl-D-alanine ligase [Halalkalibacterium halodurans]MDY7223106.1 UDP-N-acetylmuramoyl-tripeptide--D-alanyl-D-alanine ligase [Halalkalibacterium halodurans]MDY7242327.1 UDP-N-acetylmuramoyl-tripeptide--D-alanyl-D-alanine ligase [Halalkalibacterium halodurans]MED4079714.1 UDP-N-acetylmuramoyl-tripeptide--D-alanyl-D-alanine ligase [Halalkalibacterium halodurans]MED4086344.1 UDP-N-acetylmuramoyl-tripeptide--D-alanyl-D-alanine ligase [Halalkalibacterium halod
MSISTQLLKGIITKNNPSAPLSFTGVSTDTRTIQEGNLFVPLIGERFDGHDYVEQALSKGAQASLWATSVPVPESLKNEDRLLFVNDTLFALQAMAKAYLRQTEPTVVAVTGSNGKTTVKDLLYATLAPLGSIYKTQGNYNNHIGLPLTVLSMPANCQTLILEMGMSGLGEIELLSKLATPDIAVVTNIGESHLEQLGSRENIAKAKMEIALGLKPTGVLFLDGDEPLLSHYVKEGVQTVGFSSENKIVIHDLEAREDGYSFTIDEHSYDIKLIGEHNVKNAAYAVSVALHLGLSPEQVARSLERVAISKMRLEKIEGQKGALLLNDAYNASPTSMKAAIKTLKAYPNYEKKVAVLGDIYELGIDEEALHRSVADEITEPITTAVLVGEKGQWIADEMKRRGSNIPFVSFVEKEEATDYIEGLLDGKTVVLFKASRGLELESIVDKLKREEG